MVSDVPFGVLLSGGVDSSLNVALMSELMTRPVTTFTIGYEGKEDYNEFQFARRVSQRYKTDHHETLINREEAQDFLPLLVRLQDEPIADNVCIPLYFLAQAGQGQRARRSCRSARAPTRTSSATGGASTIGRSTNRSTSPRSQRRRGGGRRPRAAPRPRRQALSGEDLEIVSARASADRSCSGAAPSAGGARCASG